MKVLHVSSPVSWRGGEQQLYYLIKGLEKSGVESVVYCAQGGVLHERLKAEHRKSYAFKKSISIHPGVALQLKRIAQQEQVDLIHTHDSHAHTIAVLAHVLGMKKPIVVHRRVDYPIKEKWLNRWKYNHSSIARYVCVSKKIRDVLARMVKETAKLEVIYSGIDPSRFQGFEKGTLRRVLQLKPDDIIIANIAAVSHQKDYITWVRAVKHLINSGIKAHFVIVGGDGGELALVKDELEHLELQSHVHFLGYRQDVPALIQDIDVLMFSSRDEGLGTSILDAFLNKVPVVSTNAGGIPEMIIHEETGLLSPIEDPTLLADSCIRILSDQKLKEKIILAAFEKQKAFHVDQMVSQMIDLYKTIS